jgi:hypothetical protein
MARNNPVEISKVDLAPDQRVAGVGRRHARAASTKKPVRTSITEVERGMLNPTATASQPGSAGEIKAARSRLVHEELEERDWHDSAWERQDPAEWARDMVIFSQKSNRNEHTRRGISRFPKPVNRGPPRRGTASSRTRMLPSPSTAKGRGCVRMDRKASLLGCD